MDFSGELCLLCWIVVAVVDVGPCTCMYQVLLLSWRAQATLHQLSCDLGWVLRSMEGMWNYMIMSNLSNQCIKDCV